MVHPGGFEPPTARFVAEYSIQLSYGCIRVLLSEIVNGASGRIRTSDRSVRSRVLYPAELRMHRDLLLYCSIFISLLKQYEVIDGASGRIRTSDRSVRSRVLYPAELRMQMAVRRGFEPRMQLLTAYSLSRGAPSASRPPHHTTPLSSASSNSLRASRRCVAHILLSGTYKSNNFPKAFIVCTNHTQFACKSRKEGVL